MRLGRLLFPSIRWDAARGFAPEAERIEEALRLGVGGFIIFGGEAAAVRDLTRELQERSTQPLLIGADLERGAGQQFEGATSLPPCAALGWLDELEVSRRAGELTGREALALGVNWVYAPVADVDLEPRNPIVGARAFGADPEAVAAHVVAWVEGCASAGALSCAKHFPGHGRTVSDSHLQLPRVGVGRDVLEEDLLPFRRAIEAGVDSIMTAHVAFAALDATGTPATLSKPIITEVLRRELGYRGIVVTDALIMEGVLEAGAGEADAAVRAVAAGCDALLYPAQLESVVRGLDRALDRELSRARVQEALNRIAAAAARPRRPPTGEWATRTDREWALQVARRSLHAVRGRPSCPRAPVNLLNIDDDLGGPFPPGPRAAFVPALRAAGAQPREITDDSAADAPLLVALYADIRGWKGRPGVSAPAVERLRRITAVHPDTVVVLFGHPRLATEIPGEHVLAAWGGEPLMQEAAAAWLVGGLT